MSTDLEARITELASAWDRVAPTISLDEITGRPRRRSSEPEFAGADASVDPVDAIDPVVVDMRPGRPDRRRMLSIAAALLVVVGGVAITSRRSPDRIDPSSPASTLPVSETSVVVPGPAPEPAPVVDDSSPTAAVDVTVPEATVVDVVPVLLPADEVAERLAAIDAERRVALRAFTTIGFTVEQTRTLPDGSPVGTEGGPPMGPSRVVVRNDGSSAVVSGSFGLSYYDAETGVARTGGVGPDGRWTGQQVDGQRDSSLALGIPTGLSSGIVTNLDGLSFGVVAIEQDVVGDRDTWRIDQSNDLGPNSPGPATIETSTWIDRATGITLQTRTTGAGSVEQDGEVLAITDIVTLSDLVLDEPMPTDFPNLWPPDTEVALSGDPYQFGPITYEDAAVELGPGAVVPTIAADRVSMDRIVFGEGIENVGVTLVARWFDGFLATELRVMRFPSMMEMPDSCEACTESLLEQLRTAALTNSGVNVMADGFSVSLTGDAERIRSIIDSLVTTG